MDRYTAESGAFEEDELPDWLRQQYDDAKAAEALAQKNEKIVYKTGDQVGNFLFVKYMKFKNRAIFQCQECGRQFQYNVYTIKQKKRCKWYRFHDKKKR
jgi:transposase-like protein